MRHGLNGCGRSLALAAALLCGRLALAGENWPQFRGPSGQGLSNERGVPTRWGGPNQENVRWKTALPADINNPFSSPIVWGDKVVITTAKDKPPREQHVLCYRLSDGAALWDTPVPLGPWKGGSNNGYPTPATDGRLIYAVFGSAVIAALDFDGHLVWKKELPRYDFDVAMGSSPVVVGDTVILLCDQNQKHSSLVAFDRKSGAIVWEAMRPEMVFAHSTPLAATIGGRPELILSVSKAIQGIDPANGKVIWWCDNGGDTSSPVYVGGLVYADGGRGGAGICLDPNGEGDLTKTNIKWKASAMDGLGSPIVVGDLLYRLLNPDVLRVYRLASGEKVFSHRLEGATSWASPIATPEGNIYFASAGKSYVVKAGPKFELVAANDLGDPNNASPAVAGASLILKGQKFLWCIGSK